MPDRMLFVGLGTAVRGLEARGVEVFNEAIGLLGRMQQEGRIEGFAVALLEPNADLNGYIEIHGSAVQIADVRADEEFRASTADAMLVVDKLRHIDGYTNEGVARQLAIYQEAIGKVPQRA